jgi:type III pantothenate kinase
VLLAVDARNGSIAVGLFAGSAPVARFRLAAADRSADEYAFLIRSLIAEAGADPSLIDRGILSCVVPLLTPRLQEAISRFLPTGTAPLTVGPGVKTGLRIRTDAPGEVGSDLVCDAAAALSFREPPFVVVDFGAVLSFVAVDAPADLLGVAIAPGLDSAVAALRERAAQLPQVRLDTPARAIGRNTAESVRAGVVIGWSGLVDRLSQTMAAELGHPARNVALIGTGEVATPEAVPTRGFDLYEPYLALEGLVRISERNFPQGTEKSVSL